MYIASGQRSKSKLSKQYETKPLKCADSFSLKRIQLETTTDHRALVLIASDAFCN